ncbi:MAG: NADH-quinone oxidoreductase subunit L [Planctomycetes bacterium]|nr:NADH-quinone oxidoreductase subunit L [Planctomycetota bacterium]
MLMLDWIWILLTAAWLLPLLGFAVEVFGGYWQQSRRDRTPALIAVACIGAGFVLSVAAFIIWGSETHWGVFAAEPEHGDVPAQQAVEDTTREAAAEDASELQPADAGQQHSYRKAISGTIYTLARFGDLKLSIDYYVDSLTLVMFMMVTLIATCIHIFALGYMSDELTDEYVDHQAHTAGGDHVHRPGRYYLFFSYMSLFCFSMLGLVLAGNIFQVFIFWELVGICSYLLIGFYVERHSASTAANKAFIMNRVGDFGFLIGLMVIWTYFGTFSLGPETIGDETRPGIFAMVRNAEGGLDIRNESGSPVVHLNGSVAEADDAGAADGEAAVTAERTIPYWLLVVAGLGVFAGCIGKSAQFPLQTWLPDAMEGPTPVSALVHSATMVAAGVYLAGRFYPVFTPDVLLVMSYVGCITLFLAATIAVVATDIKRVLAYSTISQLGYMMLGIGVAGWAAGLFHLITHAFFKSLMFLCSGSVIIGCHHEQEMPRMGGLRRKMPITAYTMLVGVIAISGLAIPFTILGMKLAFSGYHSKDAIVATALAFNYKNPVHFLLFLVPLVTAGITAFYMFRLWFYTFCGEPRDRHIYDHAHESPRVMTLPLIVLAVFAAGVAVGGEGGPLYRMLLASEPAGVDVGSEAIDPTVAFIPEDVGYALVGQPARAEIHSVHAQAGAFALIAAAAGAVLAFLLYVVRVVDPGEIKRQVGGLYRFLIEKWHFDTLYDVAFVRPVHRVAAALAWFDRVVIDGILHWFANTSVRIASWDRKVDEGLVDGLVNLVGNVTFRVGRSLRAVQTGQLRQYIMFIALGVLSLFVLQFIFFPR